MRMFVAFLWGDVAYQWNEAKSKMELIAWSDEIVQKGVEGKNFCMLFNNISDIKKFRRDNFGDARLYKLVSDFLDHAEKGDRLWYVDGNENKPIPKRKFVRHMAPQFEEGMKRQCCVVCGKVLATFEAEEPIKDKPVVKMRHFEEGSILVGKGKGTEIFMVEKHLTDTDDMEITNCFPGMNSEDNILGK